MQDQDKKTDRTAAPARITPPGRINRAFLTVDLEEWYHLDYLKGYDCRKTGVRVVPRIFDFLDMLDEEGVKVTFFCVGEIAEENAGLLREIVRRGHAIGCHGLDHGLLTDKTLAQFVDETRRAREMIEAAAGRPISGYRASCFTMERDKLDALQGLGFNYDSSRIRFAQHPLYRNLDLTGFDRAEDLVYIQDGFTEYEIPTLEIMGYSIPISGGGYMRLFPFWLLRILLGMYAKKHENFTIYVHPFELTDMPLPLPKGLGRATTFRCLVGRRGNLKKLRRVIRWLKKRGARFITLEADRRERGLA
jgi:polysaccharide deacetylase family protein (PEP-CTERM system associated)